MQQTSLKKLRKLMVAGLLGICFWGASGFAKPDDWTDRIIQALEKFINHYPQEKVYLHLDKDYYAAGETIWFSGYVTLNDLPARERATSMPSCAMQKGHCAKGIAVGV